MEKYEEMRRSYMARLPLIHREAEDTARPLSQSQPGPGPGYIRINSVESPGAGASSDSSASYIKLERAERGPGEEGYSRHTTTGGGYIALMDIS